MDRHARSETNAWATTAVHRAPAWPTTIYQATPAIVQSEKAANSARKPVFGKVVETPRKCRHSFLDDTAALDSHGYFSLRSHLTMLDPTYENSPRNRTFLSLRFRTVSPGGLLLWTGKVSETAILSVIKWIWICRSLFPYSLHRTLFSLCINDVLAVDGFIPQIGHNKSFCYSDLWN